MPGAFDHAAFDADVFDVEFWDDTSPPANAWTPATEDKET
jgi:hypothetical protein